MKISIKSKDNKMKIPIFIPIFPMAVAIRLFGKKYAKKYLKDNNSIDLSNIDFKALSNSLFILKSYKGLKLVEVKSSDGTEVNIII